ncbi:MAG: hypothetical protein JWO22_1334 [Frankiales bacterium]|nr:hypothetical protein [Frankiales bacterium]
MKRWTSAILLGLAGLVFVVVAKRLAWTHTTYDRSDRPATLDEYQEAARYGRGFPWTRLYSTWLLSALLAAVAMVVVLAFLRREARAVGVALGAGAAVLTAYVAQRLPGDADLVAVPVHHTFSGVGPGAWLAVGGFLLLATSAALAPGSLPVRQARTLGALSLLGLSAWLVVHGVEFTGWYDTREFDAPYPWYLWMQQQEPEVGASYLDRHVADIARIGAAVAAALVLLAIASPVGRNALRRTGALAAVLSPVALMGVLGPDGSRAATSGFDKLEGGLWWYVAGCLVLGVAALVVPPRVSAPVPAPAPGDRVPA